MRSRLSEKPQISTTLETGVFKKPNNRERTFITNCINELKQKGQSVCFELWQIEEIKKHIAIEINEVDNIYYLRRKGD